MKTFLEVDGKMELIPTSQFRPPAPWKRERDQCLRGSSQQLPSLPPCICLYWRPHLKLKADIPDSQPPPSVPVYKSTPWPGAGKMSGNLFEDRNWLLPLNYLDNANEIKTENEHKIMTDITSPRPPIKEEPKINEQSTEKCSWGQDCPFL